MSMPVPANIRNCTALIRKIESMPYFARAFGAYTNKLSELSAAIIEEQPELSENDVLKIAYSKILSHLCSVMRDAQSSVEALIQERIDCGKITNADQSKKSTAGNVFQQMVAYTLAQNIVQGNIAGNLTVTMSTKNILEEYATIKVGEDSQKPDSDVLIYDDSNTSSPIMNFSCKTSSKERAGQTYKWKLLSDLASCECDHKIGNDKCPVNIYHLEYAPQRKIKVCFITADFYDEIAQPQIAAMFNFFDYSYVAKPTSSITTIKPLESVIDDINNCF